MGSWWCLVGHYLPVDRRETGIGKVVVYIHSYIDVYILVCMCLCIWGRGEREFTSLLKFLKMCPTQKKWAMTVHLFSSFNSIWWTALVLYRIWIWQKTTLRKLTRPCEEHSWTSLFCLTCRPRMASKARLSLSWNSSSPAFSFPFRCPHSAPSHHLSLDVTAATSLFFLLLLNTPFPQQPGGLQKCKSEHPIVLLLIILRIKSTWPMWLTALWAATARSTSFFPAAVWPRGLPVTFFE